MKELPVLGGNKIGDYLISMKCLFHNMHLSIDAVNEVVYLRYVKGRRIRVLEDPKSEKSRLDLDIITSGDDSMKKGECQCYRSL